VFFYLIPLGVEQSLAGRFLILGAQFSWVHYTGAENRKGVEESLNRIENRSHHHHLHMHLRFRYVRAHRPGSEGQRTIRANNYNNYQNQRAARPARQAYPGGFVRFADHFSHCFSALEFTFKSQSTRYDFKVAKPCSQSIDVMRFVWALIVACCSAPTAAFQARTRVTRDRLVSVLNARRRLTLAKALEVLGLPRQANVEEVWPSLLHLSVSLQVL
jgi:hypothetical protein